MNASAFTRLHLSRFNRRAASRRLSRSVVAGEMLLFMVVAALQPIWGTLVDHHYGEKRAAARAGHGDYHVAPHTHDHLPGPTRPALAAKALSGGALTMFSTSMGPAALAHGPDWLQNRRAVLPPAPHDGLPAASQYEPPPPDTPPRL